MESIINLIIEHASHAHWIVFSLLMLAGLNIPISEDLMIITTGGILIRMAVSDISIMSRNTQGVKLIRLEKSEDEYVSTVAKVEKEEEENEEESTDLE